MKLFVGTKCELIVRQYENELVGEASNNTNDVNSNTEIVASAETVLNQSVPSSNLLNVQTCNALSKILIKTKCPIVVECSIYRKAHFELRMYRVSRKINKGFFGAFFL